MVKAFDIRDRQHYVYTVADPVEARNGTRNGRGRRLSVPGAPLMSCFSQTVLLSAELACRRITKTAISGPLWVAERFEVKHDGVPFVLFAVTDDSLALSPDGRSLVTMLPVPEVPTSWETLYPPPFASTISVSTPGTRTRNKAAPCAPVRSDQSANGLGTSLDGRTGQF